jgi:hypothetical protein
MTWRLALASGFALAASGLAVWLLLRRPASPRMMQVGGRSNPCTCTQRIEP